jgi:hypothetical protein
MLSLSIRTGFFGVAGFAAIFSAIGVAVEAAGAIGFNFCASGSGGSAQGL